MQFFRPSLLAFTQFLYSYFPTAGTTQGSGGTDAAGVEVNQEVTEASSDTIRAGSRASFLNLSYVIEGIQNAYLPALRMTGGLQAYMAPQSSPSDFWEKAKEYEKILQEYIPRLLKGAATYFKSTKFTDITSNMHHILSATATFRGNVKGALEAHNLNATFDKLTEELEVIFTGIVGNLQKIPPPDKAPGHEERAEMVDKILDDTALALTNVAKRYGIEEDVVTNYLHVLRPNIEALIVAVGDINEQYPELLPALAFSVAALLIPESWILRPFLSMFGFGPSGPIKGSAAAWIQSRFWGGAVKAGSWFSLLQRAGMGKFPKWAGPVTKMPFLIGSLLALLLPRFRRG